MLRSTLVLMLLVFSVSAGAQGFDYSYLQLNYGQIEFDDVDVDGDAFGVSGSFAINPNWHAFAGYEGASLDFSVDATTLGAGIGYNTDLTPAVDLVARLSYQYVELDAPSVSSIDDSGFGLGIGLRFAASKEVELNAGITYVDFGDGGDDTAFSAGGLYNINDVFSLGLGGSWGDNASSYSLAGRFYFGK